MSEPQFDVFSREVDGFPKIFVVNRVPMERLKRLPFSVYAVIEFEAANRGLPAKAGESKVEQALISKVESMGGVYLGRVTHRGKRVHHFRMREAAPEEVVVGGLLSKAKVQLFSRPDADLEWIREEVMPTEIESELIHNTPLLETLQKQGDRSEVARTVNFGCVFRRGKDRDEFRAAALAAGYRDAATKIALPEADGDGYFFCELEAETSV